MSSAYIVRAAPESPECAEGCDLAPEHDGDVCSRNGQPRPRPGVSVETATSLDDAKRRCRRLLAVLGCWATDDVESLTKLGGQLGPIGDAFISVYPVEPDTPSLPLGVGYRIERMRAAAWPPAEQIAAVNAATAAGRAYDRTWSCFDLSSCAHALSISTEVAGWSIEVCACCGHATPAECTHPAGFEWNEAGTLLRCRTCGRDGT